MPKSILCSLSATFLCGLAGLCAPAYATVQILSETPSLAAPQAIGTTITWTVTASDTNPGPLTFQFNVAPPGGHLVLVKDFNAGTFTSVYTAQPFVWTPTLVEGAYQIQVVAKDFTSGETASKTVKFLVNPLATGSTPVVVPTANPLVALFSAPACAAGSTMRVHFQLQSMTKPPTTTPYAPCRGSRTLNFEIAGMYPSTTYNMFSQTNTGGKITNGPTVSFTTGSLPSNIPFVPFTKLVPKGPGTDTAESVLLFNPTSFGFETNYANVAVDLSGNILWYYYASPPQSFFLTRPLPNGTLLTIQSGQSWGTVMNSQLLRQIDFAGSTVRETNIGVVAQELVALGATDGGPCAAVSKPAAVGAACLDSFNHDAIQTLPNGYTAVIVDIEKIFPPGTQGDTSGLPVDIISNMILVLDTNWQVVWYFDAFQHDGGAPQLDINRPAVLNETCAIGQQDCAVILLGTGISPLGKDWLHGNSLYYQSSSGDLIFSMRHQDWVVKIDYANGAGTGDILWRMGPCGDYTFNNTFNDPWPWFSHQHEVGLENNGAGPVTAFDNGNTRVSALSGPGSSTGCMLGVGSGNSRGMSLTLNESALQVTPVLSADLGVYSYADGSAQLLSNGNYFFLPAVVMVGLSNQESYSIEILPTAGTDTGTQVLNLQAPLAYRAFRMPDLYHPPIT